MTTGGDILRSDWLPESNFKHILSALMPENRLAMEVSLVTGLRIGDVLALQTSKLDRRMTVTEYKTGKRKRVYLPVGLLNLLQQHAGRKWVFEGRLDWRKHRTRQAVYKDIKQVCKLYRLPYGKRLQISPHTARKVYAVSKYQTTASLRKVQELLNHDNEAVTMLYALADSITARNLKTRTN